MKLIRKYLYIILCSIVLLLVAVYASGKEELPLPSFYIQNPNEALAKEVSIFDANDGNYYVFLPPYADMEQVTVCLTTNRNISIADISLYDGMDCGSFDIEVPYDFSINGQRIASLCFYQSENVATMYIDTATESMEYIHKDKNYEENASITLYTADGKINYSDSQSILKGRGNSTWGYAKRPYSLILSDDGDLLDMGKATNWVLLANAHDETNLNNKLVLDLASRVGCQWVPESRWVDVYLNGEYNGLYLLTEKVEVHESRLSIDTDSGDFLCKIDINSRWKTLKHPFLTESGRTIEISYPEIITGSQSDTVTQLVNQMERSLLSGTDLNDSAIIDLDSWVRRYLIDEISGNVDSDHASSYFYFTKGMFFAGPVWDYDLAFGNEYRNQEPVSFIAKNAKRSDTYLSLYHSTLYENESFYNRMVELYTTDFVPLLQQLIDGEIENLSAYIHKASQMNSLRWQTMYGSSRNQNPNMVHTASDLISYIERRVMFLNDVWLEDIDYCALQFKPEPDSEYQNIAVRKGSCLETDYLDILSTTWINTATGQIVDFRQPVMTNMILTKQHQEMSFFDTPLVARDYIAFLSIAVLLVLLTGFMIVDAIHRHKERRWADEHAGEKVSS